MKTYSVGVDMSVGTSGMEWKGAERETQILLNDTEYLKV